MILHGNYAHILFGKIKDILIMHGWQHGEGNGSEHMSCRCDFNIGSTIC